MEDSRDLIHSFLRGHAAEAARVLENHPLDELVALFSGLPPDLSAALYEAMEASAAAACLERVEASRAGQALELLALERSAPLLRRLQPEACEAILGLLPPEPGRHLRLLLGCREDTAGALMDPRMLTLPPEVTAGEALGRVRRRPDQATSYSFVVERDETLAGVLSLRELLGADSEAPVSALMRRDVVCLRMDDSLASVRNHPGWLEFHILPVLDGQGRFAGALRHRTLRRAAGGEDPGGPGQAGSALGELYRIGLSSLVKGALDVEGQDPPQKETSNPGEQRPERPR